MKERRESCGRIRRPWLAGALAAGATSLFCACLAPGSVEQMGSDVTVLAEQLVESARQRVELNQMRVVVREIHELRPAPVSPRAAAYPVRREDPIGHALEHEFVIALATRVNVVESEMVGPSTAEVSASTLSDLASTYGATHLLVGDYQKSEYVLVVSVRLIDADSHVIVAAARGTVAFPELDEGGGPFDRRWVGASAQEPTQIVVASQSPVERPPPVPVSEPPLPSVVRASPAPPVPAPASPASSSTGGALPSFEAWRAAKASESEKTQARPTPERTGKPPVLPGPAWQWLQAVDRMRASPDRPRPQ